MFEERLSSIKRILKSTEPADCFKLQFFALKILGTFQESSANVFLKCLSIFPVFLIIKLCAMSIMYLLSEDVSLEEKLHGSFTANTSLLCVIKMYYIRKHQHKLVELVKLLKSRVNDMNEEETKTLYNEAIFPTAASYLLFQCSIFLSSTIYVFFPIGRNTYNKPLPVFAWYPQYLSEGNPYKVVYALQEMSILCAGSLWVIVDTINFGLLAHHNVMLKILSQRIAALGWTGKGPDHDTDNYKKLCDHVEYHIQILSYGSETRQIYSEIIFAKISLSVIIICSFVYALGSRPDNYGGFVAQFIILCVIVGTLFVLSWMSENISVTSDELLNKAAECNFQCMDRKTTKALLIFMQGISATVYVEVGSIMDVRLNLKMFVKIIEFAYKCLALFRTMNIK